MSKEFDDQGVRQLRDDLYKLARLASAGHSDFSDRPARRNAAKVDVPTVLEKADEAHAPRA
jgi:hypothetical protein